MDRNSQGLFHLRSWGGGMETKNKSKKCNLMLKWAHLSKASVIILEGCTFRKAALKTWEGAWQNFLFCPPPLRISNWIALSSDLVHCIYLLSALKSLSVDLPAWFKALSPFGQQQTSRCPIGEFSVMVWTGPCLHSMINVWLGWILQEIFYMESVPSWSERGTTQGKVPR